MARPGRVNSPASGHHPVEENDDHRPENLELWLVAQPTGQRVEDLMRYIAEYHADAMRQMLDKEN
jgi:hypothetical protein